MTDDAAGQLVEVTLLADALSQDAAAGDAHGRQCANCGAALTGRYCANCGQRGDVHRSVLHLVEEFFHGLLHLDGKIWHTGPLLLFRPGLLTRRYVMGERVRFVSPIALFLFSIFLMFFAVSNLDPAQLLRKNSADLVKDNKDFSGVVDQNGLFDLKGTMRKIADSEGFNVFDDPFLTNKVRESLREPELFFLKTKNIASEFSFLLVPLSLPFLWIIFCWKRGVHLYDHVIFSLHSLSFMALFGAAWAGLAMAHLAATLGQGPIWLPPLHMFFHVKGAYRLGNWGALWRTGFLLFMALIVLFTYALSILILGVVH